MSQESIEGATGGAPLQGIDVPDASATRRLSGSLGVWSIVFMVVAAAAPLTVVAGVMPLGIALGNGSAFPAAYILCSVVLLLFAVGFTRMTPHLPNAGAFYTYIRSGLGRPFGLGAAYLALATYAAVMLGVFGYVGAATRDLVDSYTGFSCPWWVYSAIAVALVALLGYRHIEVSGKVLAVLLCCEIGVVLILNLVVVANGGEAGLSTDFINPAEFLSGSPGIALMFAIASFLGFEATVVYRDEAKDPDRTIPRATYVALVLIGGFYAFSAWALVTAWGDDGAVAEANADPGGMLLSTVDRYLGGVGTDIVLVLLVSSIFAAILSFHNVASRYIFSLANAGALPGRAGRSHTHHGSPYAASLALSVFTVVMLVMFVAFDMDPVAQIFARLVGTATLGVLTLMSLTSLSVIVFFRRSGLVRNMWTTTVAPVAALVGLGACLILTVKNFSLLIGGSMWLALAIQAVLVAFFATGVCVALCRPNIATV
ncbi:APC family permease [Prescottella defluvii]|nr:APC family permease [Prescottella defluvii]